MKKLWLSFLILMIGGLGCPLFAGEVEALIARADALIEEGMRDLSNPGRTAMFLESAELCARAAAIEPDNYAANWKAARGYRYYTEHNKWDLNPGWTDVLLENGKKGMFYSEQAVKIRPEGVEGNLWYGANVSTYADAVSLLRAIREGLKNKSQRSFETVERIDEAYFDYCCLMALGRMHYILPWPLKNKKKALDYLQRYVDKCPPEAFNLIEGKVYLAEVLLDSGGAETRARAATLLKETSASQFPYIRKLSQDLTAQYELNP